MKVKEVTISLTKRELDILTMAIESYQDEIEGDEHKAEVDVVWDELYELGKVFKKGGSKMTFELTNAEARLIKTLLQNEITNDELEAERRDELVYYLGKKKGEEIHRKLYTTLSDTIAKLSDAENIKEDHGYDMGLAQIVDNDIFEQIIED